MPKKKEANKYYKKMTFDLVIKESNTPVAEFKDRRFKNLQEIIDTLNKKL